MSRCCPRILENIRTSLRLISLFRANGVPQPRDWSHLFANGATYDEKHTMYVLEGVKVAEFVSA